MNKPFLYGLLIAVAAFWVLAWLLIVLVIPGSAERGHFGDQFGSVNALFSGLAFAVIFCSLHTQHSEGKRQEERFKAQLEQQAAASRQQSNLAALASYGDLSLALWQHCERELASAKKAHAGGKEETFWDEARQKRHDQTVKALAVLESILKEGKVFDQGTSKTS